MGIGVARRYALTVAVLVGLITAFSLTPSAAAAQKRFSWTTKSEEAQKLVADIMNQIETFQATPQTLEQAKKIVELDPNFAFGHYLVATFSQTPQDAQPHNEKAVELAKSASDGERRYIEAVLLIRQGQLDKAQPILEDVARAYPDERLVWMMLGQLHLGANHLEKARTAFERASKLDSSTPRVLTFLGNIEVLKTNYNKARQWFLKAGNKTPAGVVPVGSRFAYATTFVYEGKYDEAIKTLEALRVDYLKAGNDKNFPEVFLHNAVARLYLESGNPQRAIEEYQKGYDSVKRSSSTGLDDTQRMIWLGRLHHGTGRALAKLGKHDEAWKEADTIKDMIEKGGEQGKQFMPAYHYMAGYLKLEAGDVAAAISHLEQANPQDPFHQLLLARAYERNGDKANAEKTYRSILTSTNLGLERALAYPEARKYLNGKA